MSSWCSWLSFGGYGTVEPPPPLSRALLQSGDDRTSNAIIAAFKGDGAFTTFAQKETDGILARDAEDDEKLAAGIKMAVAKGVVPAEPPLEKVTTIDVLGKSADQVAASIIKSLGDAPKSGCVLAPPPPPVPSRACIARRPVMLNCSILASAPAPASATPRADAPLEEEDG